ncbi:hypothetical protein TMEC54S_03354 [Thauera mechernichensis]
MNLHTPTKGRAAAAVSGHGRRQRGFTMLELSFILSAMAGLLLVLAYLTTDLFTKRIGIDDDRRLLLADAQVKEFAARNGRLPCPDTTNNGVENCDAGAAVKGLLPYRTLGLATQTYVAGETPLRYGVYRHGSLTGASDADLAVSRLRFSPQNSDGKAYPETNVAQANTADFCLALSNAAGQAFSSERTYVKYPAGAVQNVAYAIASPGVANRDRGATPYDLLNGADGAGFQARNTPPANDYDDKTVHRGFDELYLSLNCEVVLRSLDFVADAVAFEEEVFSLAEANQDAAFIGTILAGVGTGMAAVGLLQSGAQVAGALEVLGVSIGLLSTAAATCPLPPWVTCALIPVYSVAVASASTGVALTAAGAALNGAAVGLQIVATINYANIKSRTGLERPSSPPPATADELAALQTQRNDKNAAVLAAEGELTRLLNEEAALRNTATTQSMALDGLVAQFTAPDNRFAPVFADFKDRLLGKDTGTTETVTLTYTDASGTSQTQTVERPVVMPGMKQALDDWRGATQALARASAEHDSAVRAETGVAEALMAKNVALTRLNEADAEVEAKRKALQSSAMAKFDTYDVARLTQAAAKLERDAASAAYDACLADPVCNGDSARRAAALGARTDAEAVYTAATTARATAYTGLGLSAADSGEGGVCGASACAVLARAEAYVSAERALDAIATRKVGDTVVTEAATSARLAQQGVVSTLRSERDTLDVRIGINTCALDNKDYDAVGKQCTADAPGAGTAEATRSAVCDTTAATYDKPACDALSATGAPPPPL